MRKIILTYKKSEKPINMDQINLSALWKSEVGVIKKQKIRRGNRNYSVKEYFKIEEEEKGNYNLLQDFFIIVNESDKTLKWLGHKMNGGNLIINGDAGLHLGSKMVNGEITVNGNTDSWCGSELVNGTILVNGDAGDFIGSNYIGNIKGMTGGKILIKGSAGDFLGARLGGGEIIIKGDAGNFLGYYMINGKIIVEGEIGFNFGARMSGGIIKLNKPPRKITIGFSFEKDIDNNEGIYEKSFSVFRGDKIENGKGELLLKKIFKNNKAKTSQLKLH